MAKRKVESTSSTGSISDLISDTDFNIITNEKGSLSDKPKVETPIYALNDLLGGGLPLGAILEVYGPNASGKSSVMYETLANFQRQYPDGVAFIIDSEASTDDTRLKQLGVNVQRAPRMGASSLEDGFEQIIKILKKMTEDERYNQFPVFIIWDTIAATPTRAQIKTGEMYGGGMAERARILKNSLTNIFPLIEKQNVLLVLLNQVMADIGGWKPGLTSAGGNALQHDIHMRLEITGGKTEYDGVYATEKNSTLSVRKSKISPIINKIPLVIDITQGGVVNRAKSLVWWMTEVNPAIFKQSAWWSIEDWCYEKYKIYWDKFEGLYPKFRQKYLYEYAENNADFCDFLQIIWLDFISEKYSLQREVCKEYLEKIKARLLLNLGISFEELDAFESSLNNKDEITTEVTEETLNNISDFLSIDPESGEVLGDVDDKGLEEISNVLNGNI